jgi:hypothetical protein
MASKTCARQSPKQSCKANYLPFVCGASQYALLPKPELLPTVLLDRLRRLVGY